MVYKEGEIGKGLDLVVFDGAGLAAGKDWFSNHVGRYDQMCVAGMTLGDD